MYVTLSDSSGCAQREAHKIRGARSGSVRTQCGAAGAPGASRASKASNKRKLNRKVDNQETAAKQTERALGELVVSGSPCVYDACCVCGRASVLPLPEGRVPFPGSASKEDVVLPFAMTTLRRRSLSGAVRGVCLANCTSFLRRRRQNDEACPLLEWWSGGWGAAEMSSSAQLVSQTIATRIALDPLFDRIHYE